MVFSTAKLRPYSAKGTGSINLIDIDKVTFMYFLRSFENKIDY